MLQNIRSFLDESALLRPRRFITAPGRVLLALAVLVCPGIHAADWPQFMGPNRDNICNEKNLNFDWPETGPPLLWSLNCGEGYSPPSIADGKLIHFDRIGDEELIGCFDPASGQLQWVYKYPTTYRDRYGYNGGPRSSPTIKDGRIYTFGAQSVLSCINLEDGSPIWQRKIGEEMDLPDNFFGNGLPAILHDDVLLLNVGGTDEGWILGIDKTNGETKWKHKTLGASYSSANLGTILGKTYAAFLVREGLRIIDPLTGEQSGKTYAFRSRINDSVNGATPLIIDNQIFLTAAYRTGAAMVEFDGTGLKEIWRDATAMLCHWNTPIYHQGAIYGSSGRHSANCTMRCIDAKTGRVLWDNQNPRELSRATLLMVDGHFIALGEYGQLAALEVNPFKYVVKSKVQTPLEYPAWAPPVVSDGRLFLRAEKRLICYDLRKK